MRTQRQAAEQGIIRRARQHNKSLLTALDEQGLFAESAERRLREAAKRADIPYFNHDTPDALADKVVALSDRVARLTAVARAVSAEWHAHHYDTSTETMVEAVEALDSALEDKLNVID